MTAEDLRELLYQIKLNKERVDVLANALDTERAAHDKYTKSVDELIDAQKEERARLLAEIKRNKGIHLEAYAGYGSDTQWQTGIRLIVPLF